jgi:hypothetical protein
VVRYETNHRTDSLPLMYIPSHGSHTEFSHRRRKTGPFSPHASLMHPEIKLTIMDHTARPTSFSHPTSWPCCHHRATLRHDAAPSHPSRGLHVQEERILRLNTCRSAAVNNDRSIRSGGGLACVRRGNTWYLRDRRRARDASSCAWRRLNPFTDNTNQRR